jgi:hypothetical protein
MINCYFESTREQQNWQVERNEIALNIIRLDPMGRHVSPSVANVSDLSSLWQAAEKAARLSPPRPRELFPLPASKRALEQGREALKKAAGDYFGRYEQEAEDRLERPKEPAALVAEQQLLASAIRLIDNFQLE